MGLPCWIGSEIGGSILFQRDSLAGTGDRGRFQSFEFQDDEAAKIAELQGCNVSKFFSCEEGGYAGWANARDGVRLFAATICKYTGYQFGA
jgi:hypothetical protein